jgi:subtilisin family serine protease
VRFTYSHALNGYSASVPDAALAALRADPAVALVSPNRTFTASDTQNNPPSWGLDRIDQRALPLSNSYTYDNDGTGVTAYVIDTGIFTSHEDFGGRASAGFDAILPGGTAEDCHGHGTHVAGTVGGTDFGVAKNVTLKAVRVLNCAGSGTTEQVVAGIDWVTGDHDAGEPAVANMSLGGSADSVLDAAVQASIADGIPYAIAAGNGDFFGTPQDACTVSPARVGQAMTIGATTRRDRAASFSNFGSCVDWFAPGVDITSAWLAGQTNTISGTSMAAPHVAGVTALVLQSNPTATPAQVRNVLYRKTTKDIVTGTQTANNHLLFTRY